MEHAKILGASLAGLTAAINLASVVNRFFWEKFASNNYSFMLNKIHNAEDP